MSFRGNKSEPFGTTALPTCANNFESPISVWLDVDSIKENAQQPQTQQIANYEATKTDVTNNLLDVNQHFVVYAVKNGLIRVLHRNSALRSLLRGHVGQIVTDIQFFLDGDVLGTVGSPGKDNPNSSIFIWRVFEQQQLATPAIMSETLLEISTMDLTLSRLLWHPFNPNQFWMIHSFQTKHQIMSSTTNNNYDTPNNIATLVETTRIQTVQSPIGPNNEPSHAVCQFYSNTLIMDQAMQIQQQNLTDLCWSGRDTRHVLTVHDSGYICLWDLKQPLTSHGGAVSPTLLVQLQDVPSLSRCLFLPHENIKDSNDNDATMTTCFVTAAKNNSSVTLWSSFNEKCASNPPSKLQVIHLDQSSAPASYVMDLCFGPAPQDASPPSCFVLLGASNSGTILALHVRAEWNSEIGKNKKAVALGMDYVVPFTTKYPIYSWSVVCAPTTDISEEELQEQGGLIFDMKLFGYQSHVVQCMTLTSYMCLPPDHAWSDPTDGVRVEAVAATTTGEATTTSAAENADTSQDIQQAVISDDEAQYDEDYDLDDVGDDDDDDDGNEIEAPEPSSLPVPDGYSDGISATAGNNNSNNNGGNKDVSLVDNPFANWLGALASNNNPSSNLPPPLPPPPPTPQCTPAIGIKKDVMTIDQQFQPVRASSVGSTTSAQQFLSPMEFLDEEPAILSNSNDNSNENAGTQTSSKSTTPTRRTTSPALSNSNNNKSGKSKKSRSKSPKRWKNNNKSSSQTQPQPIPNMQGKISILKNDKQQQQQQQPQPLQPPQTQAPPPVPVDPIGPSILAPPPPPGVVAPPTPAFQVEQIEQIMTRVLTSPSYQSQLNDQIQSNVESSFENKLIPALHQAVKGALSTSVIGPIQTSLKDLQSNGVEINRDAFASTVAGSVQEPVRAAMADSLRHVLIPSIESVTGQILSQVNTHIAKPPPPPPPPPPQPELLDAVSKLNAQLSTMAKTMEAMSSEIKELKLQVSAGINNNNNANTSNGTNTGNNGSNDPSRANNNAGVPAGTAAFNSAQLEQRMAAIRNEILVLLKQKQFEAAFTKALSASSADMALFCCSNASISEVFGGGSSVPTLSQPILLCVMQQLGAIMVSTSENNLQICLLWLQEIALSLNPADAKIQRHVQAVLQQVVQSINQVAAATNHNPMWRRQLHMLLQVIRGMQMG